MGTMADVKIALTRVSDMVFINPARVIGVFKYSSPGGNVGFVKMSDGTEIQLSAEEFKRLTTS